MSSPLAVRELGARGSKVSVSDAGDAADLPGPAVAVLATVPQWWRARAEAVGLSGRWLDVAQAVAVAPPVLPDAESFDLAEIGTAGEALGRAYVSALSPQVRARHGRHYTPTGLAEQLWAMTRRALGHGAAPRRLTGPVRDPACGAGALLLPPLREHLAALRCADPRMALATLPSVIEGVDADPAAVWLADVILAAEALPILAAVPEARRRPLAALTSTGDGLAPVDRPAAAVVMNPPYGRVRLDSTERKRFAPFLYGHANLYALFLAAGLESLGERGVLSALVPTSFTAGRYFASLRGALAEDAPLRELTFVAERDGVFSGVLQETCLATFTRTKARKTAVFSSNGHLTPVANVPSPRGAGPWLLPRRADDAPVAAAAAAMPLTLAAAGWRVSTGPLVWNRRRADLHTRPGPDRFPVLWAADIDGGRLHRDQVRDGFRYLHTRDEADRVVMTLSEPAIVVQRTTAPEQTRRIVTVELSCDDLAAWGGTVVVENHVNVLRPASDSPAIGRAALARVLATPTMDRVMRCLAGSVAVSAYELRSLPLPAAEQLAAWESLTGAALDAAVRTAYQPGAV
jgi:adenine-specific DNA-methyltransferase